MLVAQLYLTFCNPLEYSLLDSSVHGIPQERILEWVAISFSRGIFPTQGSNPGLLHCRQILYHQSHQGSPNSINWLKMVKTPVGWTVKSLIKLLSWNQFSSVAQSCPILCDPMDYTPPGSSIHGIFQERILEWVAISFSRSGLPFPSPGYNGYYNLLNQV